MSFTEDPEWGTQTVNILFSFQVFPVIYIRYINCLNFCFFGMTQVENAHLGIQWWLIISTPAVGFVFALYLVDVPRLWDRFESMLGAR